MKLGCRDGADTERACGALRPQRREPKKSEPEYDRCPPGGTGESADSGREMSGYTAHKLPVSLKAAQRSPDEMVAEG